MSKSNPVVLSFTMGLPGSGKTHWAEREAERLRVSRVDVDYSTKLKHKDGDPLHYVMRDLRNCLRNHGNFRSVILDGLFLDTKGIFDILEKLETDLISKVDRVAVHVWKVDRKLCLVNDSGRRDQSSRVTIENAVVEEIDEEAFRSKLRNLGTKASLYVEFHAVTEKPDWKKFMEEKSINADRNGRMTSETWKTGGNWCDYNGNCHNIDSEDAPAFHSWEQVLEMRFTVAIPDEAREEIWERTVNTEEDSECDYYGGRAEFAWYTCNLEYLLEVCEEIEQRRGLYLAKDIGIIE